MEFRLTQEEASLVLLGPFKPGLFHPGWFVANDLVRPEDLKECQVELLNRDLSIFGFEWISFFIDRNRFQAKARENAFFEQLRDLVLGTLSILQDANVHAVGINRAMHFHSPSQEAFHSFGDMVAPKGPWTGIRHGDYGLSRMIMQRKRESPVGYVQTSITPSNEFNPPDYGLYFEINNHYENNEKDVSNILSIIENYWEIDLQDSLEFIETLLKRSLK